MTASTPARRRRTFVRSLAVALALVVGICAAGGAPAQAELVVLSDGDFLKVASFRLIDKGYELELPSGGLLILPRQRVSRIVDDEIVSEADEPEVDPPRAFTMRFAEQPAPSVPYGDEILAVSKRHGLNPDVIAALIYAESSFRPEVVSHKGAQGLMQLMPATAARFGLRAEEVFEVEKNLDAGARYLRWLADRFDDDLPLVLAGYNAGEGAVDRYGGVPPYRETVAYVEKITAALGWSQPPGPASAAGSDG
ncbi:MAG: lytic transglycosylase domain-containing protein [Acidobacteriota bacterium]